MIDVLLMVLALDAASRDVAEIEDVSLDELLGSETTVSSTKSTRMREAPGAVTVVTREDILRIGARDLSEVLPLVPGFDLYADVGGTIGATFRGLYAGDGRTLLLIDGVEMNEIAFGSLTSLFNNFPLDDVERIEILRGPGSASWGGYASLAVISITTRSQSTRHDAGVVATYGQAALDAPFLNQSLGVMGGTHVDAAGLDVSLDAHASTRTQSLRDMTDAYGTRASLRTGSASESVFVNARVRGSAFDAQLVVDQLAQASPVYYDSFDARLGNTTFPAIYLKLRVPLALAPTLTVTPTFFATRQLPWRPATADAGPFEWREVDDRLRAGVRATWQALPRLAVMAGVDGTIDNTTRDPTSPRELDVIALDLNSAERYANGAAYAEATVDTDLASLTMGARGEVHSAFGAAFVPRIALTRAFDGAHVKLQVAGSFRAPGIDNISGAIDGIEPERTRVLELEGGVAVLPACYVTLSAFDVTINNPIVYSYDNDRDADVYQNFSRTGSRGLEASLLATAPWGRLELSYSLASASNNEVAVYGVPGDAGRLLGAPQHKGVALASIYPAPGLTMTLTAVARSSRAAQVGFDDDGAAAYGELPASTMVGAAVRFDSLVPGIDATLGVKNALGEPFELAQPYASSRPPQPFDDTEVYVRLAGTIAPF